MRMDELFDDLAAQASAVSDRILWDEAQEMSRAEATARTLLDRMVPGQRVRLWLAGGHVLDAVVSRVGADVLVAVSSGREWLVPAGSVPRVRLGPTSGARVREAVAFSGLLRSLARDRAQVAVMLADADVLHGRLLGCGNDHCEVAEPGQGRTLVSLASVVALLRGPGTADQA